MPRQQGGVQIDRRQAGQRKHVLAQNLPVGHHDHNLRFELGQGGSSLADHARLQHWDACFEGLQLDCRWLQRLMAPHRFVRLGHQRKRSLAAFQQAAERWQGDLARANKNHPHFPH